MKNGVYISSEACTPVFRKNGEYPMSDVYSERLFSRETRVSAWFASSNVVAGKELPSNLVLWPAFVERSVLKPGEGFRHKNYTRFAVEIPLEGSLICEARGETAEIRPGEIFLIHYGEDSAFHCAPEGGCRKISIGFSGPLVQGLVTELQLVNALVLSVPALEPVLKRVIEIEHLLASGDRNFIELSTLSFRFLAEVAERIDNRYPPLLKKALAIMKANISQNLTIMELAEKLETSQTNLEHLFHEYLGNSPRRYFAGLKFARAKELLCRTNLPVYQIARNVGYEHSMHFCRRFRALCGVSPAEFRKVEKRK